MERQPLEASARPRKAGFLRCGAKVEACLPPPAAVATPPICLWFHSIDRMLPAPPSARSASPFHNRRVYVLGNRRTQRRRNFVRQDSPLVLAMLLLGLASVALSFLV